MIVIVYKSDAHAPCTKRKSTKMKDLLLVLSLVIGCVLAEAPYPASGWRPTGPAFEFPQSQYPQKLPVDPRRPTSPSTSYGFPEDVDVSVQGLPTPEQLPLFQVSPVNGQQYVGPRFNTDIKSLDQSFRQMQYQLQQEKAREFDRQKQLEFEQSNPASRTPNQQIPRQFVPQSTPPQATTTPKPDFKTAQPQPQTTPETKLNEGEVLNRKEPKEKAEQDKVTVEVTKQNVQEYPPELLLGPLAQLRLQPQLVPLQQLGQIRAPVYFQPQISQEQVSGYDAQTHFAALPSILAQRQQQEAIQTQQFALNPAIVANTQQKPNNPGFVVQQPAVQPVNQYQPQYPQFQGQPTVYQPQPAQIPTQYGQPKQVEKDAETINSQNQPQFVFQTYQPQDTYQQPFPAQSPNQGQFVVAPAQLNNFQNQDLSLYYQTQQYQPQFFDQSPNQFAQQQASGQDAFLQSGLDINQQGNGIEPNEERESDGDGQDDENTATAVATAFGARSQPRVLTQYGAPIPRAQLRPSSQTTTELPQEEATEQYPSMAEATAVARGGKRKSAKLRSRRIRPVFTLDRSGHLVLAQEQ